jgi:tRNA(Ile)-lysidine synthase
MGPVETVRHRLSAALAGAGMPSVGERVLVACSGGPDSMVLVDALAAVARPGRFELHVASIDHQLRPEARAEVAAVCTFAAALGLPATARAVVTRPNPAAARQARYEALVEIAHEVDATALAVAHTATDQAETMLDRLIRGAGTKGLSAMARVRPLGPSLRLVRPLLDVTRAEVEAYVAERGLPVARDPSNLDPAYRRSRLRHDVLPLLRRERGDLDQSLSALCDRLRADADFLDGEAERARAALEAPSGLDVRGLVALPDALASRVVALAAGVPLEAVHIEAVRRLCADARGTRTLDLPGGVVAERRYGRLRFLAARAADPGDLEMLVTGPGRYTFCEVQVDIRPETFAAFGPALVLRNVRPGDHLRSRKVKRIFIDEKVPKPDRRRLPLLVRRDETGEEVLWIARVDGRMSYAIMEDGEPSVVS